VALHRSHESERVMRSSSVDVETILDLIEPLCKRAEGINEHLSKTYGRYPPKDSLRVDVRLGDIRALLSARSELRKFDRRHDAT
jgi:hypothetical protein